MSSAQRNRSPPAPGNGARCEQKTDTCPNEQQRACPNRKLMMPEVIEIIGAGEVQKQTTRYTVVVGKF
jgi:hypothetical protein